MAYSEELDKSSDERLREFARKTFDELLAKLPKEKRLKLVTPEERLEGLSPEERLKGLSPADRLKGLSVEDLLRGLPPETLEGLKQLYEANSSSAKPQ